MPALASSPVQLTLATGRRKAVYISQLDGKAVTGSWLPRAVTSAWREVSRAYAEALHFGKPVVRATLAASNGAGETDTAVSTSYGSALLSGHKP